MSPSQKENQSEQTNFRLSVERGCHPGGAGAGYVRTSGQHQDHHQGEDQQEASQQESHPGEQHQRQARRQVSKAVIFPPGVAG